MVDLRPYQKEAVNEINSEFKSGKQRIELVLPPGMGKTVVYGVVIKDFVNHGKRSLLLTNRDLFLYQASNELRTKIDLKFVIENKSASSLGSPIPVTIATVKSLIQENRLYEFPSDYFDLIVIDESQHCVSESYQQVLEHFPNAKILGATATPERGDKKSLGKFSFDSIISKYSIESGIEAGYLKRIMVKRIPLKLDLSDVNITGGDLNQGKVAIALEPYLEQIAIEMKKYCADLQTLVFLPLNSTSYKFCRILNNVGLPAAVINGDKDDYSKYSKILHDFEIGKYKVLCSSMLLTESWNCPSIDCIVILRPTKHREFYTRMVGRGLRKAPGKENLLLLDFLWRSDQLDLCTPSKIITDDKDLSLEMEKHINSENDLCDLVDVKQKSNDITATVESNLADQLEKNSMKDPEDFDLTQRIESIYSEVKRSYSPKKVWQLLAPTDNQLHSLKKWGITRDRVKDKGFASALIDALERKGPPTRKQILCLKSHGVQDVNTLTYNDASYMISDIKYNGDGYRII